MHGYDMNSKNKTGDFLSKIECSI